MSDLRPRRELRQRTVAFARHGRLRRSSPVATVVKYLSAALAVVLVSVGTVAGVAVWGIASTVKPGVSLVGETDGPPPDIGAFEGGVNFLLVGSDGGEGDPRYGKREAKLNDVTMLMHVSADHTNATVVSFPRDMFVPIPACPREDGNGTHSPMSSQKINTTLSYGGLACTVLTVSELTGLDIPFAALIEMNGVIEMSNAIGGVEVCVATPINDRQIGFRLPAGMQTIEGNNAQLFLRSRYGVGDGSDLGRISNQQVFLSALVRQVKSAETLSNPVAVYGLAKAVVSNMELSNSLQNVNTLISIALALKDIPTENINFVQYPTAYGNSGSQSGVLPIKSLANDLFAAIKADQPVKLTGKTGPGSKPKDDTPPPPTQTDASPSTSPSTSPDAGESTPDATAKPPVEKVELPSSIVGQNAALETCSKGQSARG